MALPCLALPCTRLHPCHARQVRRGTISLRLSYSWRMMARHVKPLTRSMPAPHSTLDMPAGHASGQSQASLRPASSGQPHASPHPSPVPLPVGKATHCDGQ